MLLHLTYFKIIIEEEFEKFNMPYPDALKGWVFFKFWWTGESDMLTIRVCSINDVAPCFNTSGTSFFEWNRIFMPAKFTLLLQIAVSPQLPLIYSRITEGRCQCGSGCNREVI